jgi:hypothetical protein
MITAICEADGDIDHHHRFSVKYSGAISYLHCRVRARSGGNRSHNTASLIDKLALMMETSTSIRVMIWL